MSVEHVSDATLPAELEALVDDYMKVATAPRRPLSTTTPTEAEALQALLRLGGAMSYSFPTGGTRPLKETEQGRKLLALAPSDKLRVAIYAYAQWSVEKAIWSPWERIFSDLLRSKLDASEAQALALLASSKRLAVSIRYGRISSVLGTLKRHVETHTPARAVSDGLRELGAMLRGSHADSHLDGRQILKSIDEIVALAEPAPGPSEFKPKHDVWGTAIAQKLAHIPHAQRAPLTRLLNLAATGGDAAKPAKTWLKQAAAEVGTLDDPETIGALILDVIALYDCDRRKPRQRSELLTIENQATLRALLWLAAMAAPRSAGRRLEEFAQTYLTWVALDYNSLVLGNAAIHAFTLLDATEGAAGLSRLRRHLKRPGEVKAIDKALAALAQSSGTTAEELEETGLPDFGFDANGTLTLEVGPAAAQLTITPATTLVTTWRDADGTESATPPAALKETHKAALAAFKAKATEIDETLKAQRLRFERLYLTDRAWPLAVWRERYLESPLVATLTRRLIWSFEIDGAQRTGLPAGDGIFDATGTPLSLEGENVRVKLWHPIRARTEEVLAWRRRLTELAVTQPFKQAHREIYVLTDAERETRTYSHRFAAHILTQKLLRALTLARGWKMPLQGQWSSGQGPILKELPAANLRFELSVEPIEASANERWTYEYLTTGRVGFSRFLGRAVPQTLPLRSGGTFEFVAPASEAVPLEEIDPVVFSEMMRDVDLFVGVAGIGNDPTWGDRAAHGFLDYWRQEATGTLVESGQVRRHVLAELLPSLSIASRCRLEDRYLVVEGKLRTYRIHLGSANIMMEPNNRYLCIVPESRLGSNIYLPFEGDRTLSIILSKAFMLAADDKIKDRSIRAQIENVT